MASQQIPPLRIQKGNSASSPGKLSFTPLNKPLSELSPMAIRRNSPSFPQPKVNQFVKESSPAGSSPFTSPRLFWKERDPTSPSLENNDPHEQEKNVVPAKRSSIENLKKASRVKNSSMFELEKHNHYDPSRPAILDGRPQSGLGFSNLRSSEQLRKENIAPSLEQPFSAHLEVTLTPLGSSRSNVSPTKSSLSKRASGRGVSYFDPQSNIYEDDDVEEKQLPDGRGLHRHAKSVTFDHQPPQVNEYEMQTPDPSSVASGSREGSYESAEDEEEDEEYGFQRGSSMDHDDSFDASLEDFEKTPVVLPEDWRFMSPDTANKDLAKHEEDVFADENGSPEPHAQPGVTAARPQQSSVNSVDSSGQPRPLPPLPPKLQPTRDSLQGTIERISNSQRSLPPPPQAPMVSKSDIRRMSGSQLSMEDRLRLMMIQDPVKSSTDNQRERRMRRAESKDSSPARSPVRAQEPASSIDPDEHEREAATTNNFGDSVIRHMRSSRELSNDSARSTPTVPAAFDPDVPIPSLEDPTQSFNADIEIKPEETDDNDPYSIPDFYSRYAEPESDVDEDLASQYSQASIPVMSATDTPPGDDTPRLQSPKAEPNQKALDSGRISLPEFTTDFGMGNSFSFGLDSYITPTEEANKTLAYHDVVQTPLPDLAALRASIQRPFTPEESRKNSSELPVPPFGAELTEPGSPTSVIRHPTTERSTPETASIEEHNSVNGNLELPSPVEAQKEDVEDVNTVDLVTHTTSIQLPAETGQQHQASDEPPKKRVSSFVQLEIPEDSHEEDLGFGLEKEFDRVVQAQKVQFELSLERLYHPFNGRFPSSELPVPKDSRGKGPFENIPVLAKPQGARAYLGDSLYEANSRPPDGQFANRRSPRQRGYLMRQNTKLVVASERISHDEPRPVLHEDPTASQEKPSIEPNQVLSSPRNVSQPTWTAEPWNGKRRRKSIRIGGEKDSGNKKVHDGPVPPLPGQFSNVQDALGAVAEDEMAEEEAEDFEDGAERGRLFVKIIGVKDLQLPFPSHERTYFALTLDNGLHCVTTAWLDLARSAPIGQEFELIVLNDLEFQLTLQMKLEPPKVERAPSPVKAPSSPKKQNAFGRLFGSPKKRKDSEPKAQETEAAARRPVTPPSAYELVQGLVGKDGSFARAYVNLNEHEGKTYGRPYGVDIKCFNEWAMEEVSVGSSRSKKGVTELQQRPPYEIGNLEVQLLFVPKPKNAKDEDMPKSMNGAIRAMREADEKLSQSQKAEIKEFQGHLSQQGGDCPYWRRRYFKLVGSKLTAYHEATLQPRATINLAKATKLIDDKTVLTQRETSSKHGGRRKSGFAEEEEGYMFVEEGFRIRFKNGEVIDFYADSTAQKEEWMQVLDQVVGKEIQQGSGGSSKSWTDMVLKREKGTTAKDQSLQAGRKQQREQQLAPPMSPLLHNGPPVAARGPSTRPASHTRTESYQPEGGSRSQASSPVKQPTTKADRYRKTKSMVA